MPHPVGIDIQTGIRIVHKSLRNSIDNHVIRFQNSSLKKFKSKTSACCS